MNKSRWWVFLVVVLLGVGLRCYQITEPDITDFHAWRQADTAAFTRGFLIDTLNPFFPSVDRYPCQYRGEHFGRAEAELPVVAWLAALPLAALGMDFPPVPYLRAVSIFFFVLTCIYLFLLVLRLDDDEPLAFLAVLAFSLIPLSVFFTRTIQPDGPSLFFATAFLYHLLRWLEDDEPVQGVVSCLFGMLVMLLKISNGYLLFPAVFLFISRKTLWGSLKTPKYWAWGIALLLPLIAWSLHAHQFAWSFGIWGDAGGSKFSDWKIFSDPNTWRDLSARLTFDILTWSGVVLLVVGLTRFRERPSVRLGAAWAGGFALFVCTALKGNMTHVYYQLPIVLPAAILIAVGIRVLWKQRVAGKLALAAALAVYLVSSYHILTGPEGPWQNGYFADDVSPAIKEATRLVREHLEPGEKFVSTVRHPALFFNSRHRGWFYEGRDTLGFIGCAGPDARYILWDRGDRARAQAAIRRDSTLRERVTEVKRGKYFSLWRLEDANAATHYLAAVGGSRGGRSFRWNCPAGHALRGFDALPGTETGTINTLKPICAPIAGDPETSAKKSEKVAAKSKSPKKKTPKYGHFKSSAEPLEMRCESGKWVVGLQSESIGVVHDLQLICAYGGTPPSTPPPANRCAEGSVATGVYGRSGKFVDAIGLHCAPPRQ